MQSFNILRVISLLIMVVGIYGCFDSDKEKNQEDSTKMITHEINHHDDDYINTTSNSGYINEFYTCSNTENLSLQEQSWCEAKSSFQKSTYASNPESLDSYVKGYRSGINQARLARDKIFVISATDKDKNIDLAIAETGFIAGYDSVVQAIGLVDYKATEDTTDTEDFNYQKLWLEASDFYQSAGFSLANPFVKFSYINGFMAGAKIAVSQDSSMTNLFDPEETKNTSAAALFTAPPENSNSQTVKAFEQGVYTGHQAMLDNIRESIEKLTKQMFEDINTGDFNPDMSDIVEQMKQLDDNK